MKTSVSGWVDELRASMESLTGRLPVLRKGQVMGICNYCGGPLPFPPWKAGELVNCPNCLMETILTLPDAGPAYTLDRWRLKLRRTEWGLSELGYRAIIGEVVNQSGSDLDWARIDFRLLNKADEPVGNAMDLVFGLAAGTLWRFSAPVFDDTVVRTATPVLWSEFGRMDLTGAMEHRSRPGREAGTLTQSCSWTVTKRHTD